MWGVETTIGCLLRYNECKTETKGLVLKAEVSAHIPWSLATMIIFGRWRTMAGKTQRPNRILTPNTPITTDNATHQWITTTHPLGRRAVLEATFQWIRTAPAKMAAEKPTMGRPLSRGMLLLFCSHPFETWWFCWPWKAVQQQNNWDMGRQPKLFYILTMAAEMTTMRPLTQNHLHVQIKIINPIFHLNSSAEQI